jgi:hypothetical protein
VNITNGGAMAVWKNAEELPPSRTPRSRATPGAMQSISRRRHSRHRLGTAAGAAPPCSSTRTFRPARASSRAAMAPAGPLPIMSASSLCMTIP